MQGSRTRRHILERLYAIQMVQILSDASAPRFEAGWAKFYWILIFVQAAIEERKTMH